MRQKNRFRSQICRVACKRRKLRTRRFSHLLFIGARDVGVGEKVALIIDLVQKEEKCKE
jgi:hypothetical protein